VRVAIAGAHGQIARSLTRVLAERGDEVVGLIRNPDHADDVRADGAEPELIDLETARAEQVAEADAVVFAAGAGPGSGAERKLTVDRDGAVKLLDGARSAGVPRYLIVSSVGAESPPADDDVFSVYLRAKAEADAAVAASDRDWTIVRPGGLTDDPGTGRVEIAERLERRGQVSRDDVAAVLAEVLRADNTIGKSFDLLGGETPIPEAVASV